MKRSILYHLPLVSFLDSLRCWSPHDHYLLCNEGSKNWTEGGIEQQFTGNKLLQLQNFQSPSKSSTFEAVRPTTSFTSMTNCGYVPPFREGCIFGGHFGPISRNQPPAPYQAQPGNEYISPERKDWVEYHNIHDTIKKIESNLKFSNYSKHTHIRTKSSVTRNQTRKTVSFMGFAFSFIYVYITFWKENKDKGHDSCISMDWSGSVNWIF